MKRINFEIIFKVIILAGFAYLLFLLTAIVEHSGNGRYQQFTTEYPLILDTKTGQVFKPNDKGQMQELGKK
ncbi:MAG: hypothetical protein Q8M15_14525 [Bacteroidota bacterium]|nr:hypothetical protein [Bacteroidota bacterium]